MEDYGKVTIDNNGIIREVSITSFIQSTFKNNRIISVCETEENSFLISVENPKSSGRNEQQTIHLSKESLIGFISTCAMFFMAKGENIEQFLKESIDMDEVNYSVSNNLSKINPQP